VKNGFHSLPQKPHSLFILDSLNLLFSTLNHLGIATGQVGYGFDIPVPVPATPNPSPPPNLIPVRYLNFYPSLYSIEYRDTRLARYPRMHNKKIYECFIGGKPESVRHPNLKPLDTRPQTKSIEIEIKKLIS